MPSPPRLAPTPIETIPFGAATKIERLRLDNGLELLLCEDHSAKVVSYHTWFKVGSRNEVDGKTGLSHLFEHLMFRETEHLAEGEYDKTLEEAGAENNAATWLDWTQYTIAVPSDQLELVVRLEAERMEHLVLREPQVAGEKEVVANERRYRVDDDVEGAVSELLWATAFTKHSYRWPTIGWMRDIEGFTTADCEAFYRTYYAPNNAVIVVVGDFDRAELLDWVTQRYGHLPASALPIEDIEPEPPQIEERRVEVEKPTETEKVAIGWHAPALGDRDHVALSLLADVLFSGRASRLTRRLVRELELASDVRCFVGTFKDPGLTEIFASARGEHTAEELLAVIDEEIERVRTEAIPMVEIERARARSELGLLASLESADGKANTIGFYEAVLGKPSAAFERLEELRRLGPNDLLRAARRWFPRERRSVILVRPSGAEPNEGAEAAE